MENRARNRRRAVSYERRDNGSSVGMHGNMDSYVRRAVAEDAESIAAVHIRSWQTAYRGQLPDRYLDHLGEELERRTALWRAMILAPPTNKHEVWVGGAHVDGFVALGPAREADPDVTGELYAIYVNPIRWGQGLGRTLFSLATKRLAELGFATAMLWVLESNVRARRF